MSGTDLPIKEWCRIETHQIVWKRSLQFYFLLRMVCSSTVYVYSISVHNLPVYVFRLSLSLRPHQYSLYLPHPVPDSDMAFPGCHNLTLLTYLFYVNPFIRSHFFCCLLPNQSLNFNNLTRSLIFLPMVRPCRRRLDDVFTTLKSKRHIQFLLIL